LRKLAESSKLSKAAIKRGMIKCVSILVYMRKGRTGIEKILCKKNSRST